MINPATGETIANVAEGTAGGRRPRRRGRREGRAPGVARHDAGRARRAAAQGSPTRSRSTPRSWPSSSRSTSASRSRYARDEIPVCADNIRFFAGAARVLEGRSAGEYMRGYTSMIRREPLGRRRLDRALELPADDGGLEDRARARRGQRPGAEALRADAADDASLRRSWPPTSSRRACFNVITGDGEPVGAGSCATRDVRLVSLTGRRRHRQGGRAGRRGHAQEGPPRARRQGPGDRLRRRRPGAGRRGDQDRRLLELRAGLHGRLARDSRPEDLRQPARGARARGRVDRTWAIPPRATTSRWAR